MHLLIIRLSCLFKFEKFLYISVRKVETALIKQT